MTYIYTYTKRPYISTKPTKQNTHHSSTNKISPLRFVVLIQSHRCNSTGMFPSSVPLAVATASATAEAKAKSSSKDGSDDVGPATALEKKWSKRRISRSSGFFVTFLLVGCWLLMYLFCLPLMATFFSVKVCVFCWGEGHSKSSQVVLGNHFNTSRYDSIIQHLRQMIRFQLKHLPLEMPMFYPCSTAKQLLRKNTKSQFLPCVVIS